ncbi:MAG: methylated-DNA--[protein]-cysteine S-methyltransferase [Candidatus Tectimicrobiota bacterium]
MRPTCYTLLDSPFGMLCIVGSRDGLIRVNFQPGARPPGLDPHCQEDTAALATARRQLQEYCAGQRRTFTLPLAPAGTPFQQRVWQALQAIPFGEVWTYRQLARQLGMPQAARAIGHANGRNPLAIVVPCHRLIGSDGHLRGHAGGLRVKQQLLRHEGVTIASPLDLP